MANFPYLDFFTMIHCMASYYQPSSSKPFRCVFESCVDMIPTDDPLKVVIYEAYQQIPLTDFDLSSNDALLQWTYRINSYVHRQLYNSPYIEFIKFKEKYDPANMTITTWSHPTWKMIHYLASMYNLSEVYALSYKAFVSCLQFLLPCPKCKEHLTVNLSRHPIDEYFGSAIDLFTWSYVLHQTVSSSIGKSGISLRDAKKLYDL